MQDLRAVGNVWAVEKGRHNRRLLPQLLPPKADIPWSTNECVLRVFVYAEFIPNREGHFWELCLADFLHVEARIALAVRQIVVTAQRVRQGFLQIRAFCLRANANEKNRALEA